MRGVGWGEVEGAGGAGVLQCSRAVVQCSASSLKRRPAGGAPTASPLPPLPAAAVAPAQVRKTARVVRAMCVLSHPIPSTGDSHSVQIILPQKQLNRRHGAWASGGCGCGGGHACVGGWAR